MVYHCKHPENIPLKSRPKVEWVSTIGEQKSRVPREKQLGKDGD